ncbi:putative enzyme with ATPase activity [Hyalangium minutum]|uniref:Putative enzyme with ATPase activity n=2 Tax=Hyalangium minutum TaxID=394096 RepID=A0A085WB82_9BACT|nr:putative enzyme with ATPase activity [Hyalangium minutum]
MVDDKEPLALKYFRIVGLHGKRTFKIPFDGKRLVLVGENGTGKSTVVSMIYYALTRQWERLDDYEFKAIQIGFSGEEIEIAKADLPELHRGTSRERGPFSSGMYRIAEKYVSRHLKNVISRDQVDKDALARELSEVMGISMRMAVMLVWDVVGGTGVENPAASVNAKLLELFNTTVLFLPTYRRIERDLKAIFPNLEKHIEEFRQSHSRRKDTREYIELVEFGMHDIDIAFGETMSQLKEDLRKGLDALTGEYLRDALKKGYDAADVSLIRELDEPTLNSILGRIDEKFLPSADKESLKKRISSIRTAERVQYDDRVVAHFFGKLIALHKRQADKESSVRAFVDISNKYLENKRVEFDNGNFTIKIVPIDDSGHVNGEPLPPKMLSSGEKQIVSLFTHLFLTSNEGFFVIIDEPELSLSVPWQERFLPDIWGSGRCKGLLAVTHSPFIYSNYEMKDAAHALMEFVEG